MMPPKPKIAFWFRYGPAEHSELFHAIPEIVEELSQQAEVHYFGLRSAKPVPPLISRHATLHLLPFTVNRANNRDKQIKTLLWLMCLPWIGIWCRFTRVKAVYIDETLPLAALLARIFFGCRVAITVADFFPEIYWGQSRVLRPLVHLIRALDLFAWRHLPLIFTRAKATRTFLEKNGVSRDRVVPVYDPCDFSIYHPEDPASAKAKFGYASHHLVLVHHGILHPNKGNDRVLKVLAATRTECPALRYLLVGDGPERARLEELARDLGVADIVQFTGWLPSMADVNTALNAGDIGLVMRTGMQEDDFHMTGALVHNMACGLPILAARLGGVSEVIKEEEAGLLFDPADPDEFRAKLLRLATDAPLRRRMSPRSLDLARQLFDMESVVIATARPLLKLAGIDCDALQD
jgi:glycosyltransferase involved in cell wall biosynthesis